MRPPNNSANKTPFHSYEIKSGWKEARSSPRIFAYIIMSLLYMCQLMQHTHASLQVEGEVRAGSIAVQAMRSSVEGTEEDLREATTTVVGVGRLPGGACHPRGEGQGSLLQVLMSRSVKM